MAAELALIPEPAGEPGRRDIVDGWVTMAAAVFKLADHICDTDFVPDAYRGNAPAVAAAILAGRELGIGPMTSLRHVQVVKGSPSLSAEYKRARVLAAGHEFRILEHTTTLCRVQGRRRGSSEQPLEVRFSMDDAKRAGLLNPSRSGKPGAWQTRPRRMLFARASSELCDLMFSDVVNGLATTELLAEGTEDDTWGGYDEQPAPGAPKPATPGTPKTARRKTAAAGDDTRKPGGKSREGTDPGTGDSTARDEAPRAAGAAPSRGAQPLPPLPGEPGPDAAPPAAEPGERHRRLVGVIRGHFKRLGYTDDDAPQRLADTAVLAGTSELGSTNDLDEDELKAVADTLSRCRDIGQLKALLDAARAAKEEAGSDDD